MLEIIIINPKEEKPTVTKGDFAFVVTNPVDGESNAIFMGSGSALMVASTLGIACRKTLENITEGNPLFGAALIDMFKEAFEKPDVYAKTHKTDSVPEY